MTLRLQKSDIKRQKPWKLEEVQAGFEDFYEKNGRYPTSTEIDKHPYLPSARQIERNFGGVVVIRKNLKHETQSDFRSGAHSSARAFKINKRAHSTEKLVYDFLVKKFKKELVHREYFFSDDKRTRADFFIYDKSGNFCVDVFYPSDKINLVGCLNSRLRKYEASYMNQCPMIFLQMNEKIPDSLLEDVVANKDKPLANNQQLMGWGAFKDFCSTRRSLWP